MAAGLAAIRIESSDGTDDELRALTRWLRDEVDLRGRVNVVREQLPEGQMGGYAELVTVVLTSSTAQVLVTSLFNWLERRRNADRVSVTVDGQRVEINAGSVKEAEKLLRLCRRGADDG